MSFSRLPLTCFAVFFILCFTFFILLYHNITLCTLIGWRLSVLIYGMLYVIYLFIYLLIYLFIYLFIYIFIYLFIYLFETKGRIGHWHAHVKQ